MEIQLIKGSFEAKEAAELLNKLFKSKIQFHESKINNEELNEEDIKMRERRIIELQNELTAALSAVRQKATGVELNATVRISLN
ncbi:hypothetical protein MUY27_07680 [Mucilaginibacter sp. RS28]|uniref:Uncharacterized protein n=1 Tax=Mucilaginibacter straminoryzae TaxID=2932774 RepID=A0A9X1X3G0_9SPHI|nr:hypothetical protein [Mucilaginibacter straminoryzae]MCJ8209585.1 hypothetical protein [Mucilaginibacter straminoryzae]